MKSLIRLAVAAVTLFLIYFALNFSSLYERVKLDRSFPALSRYAFEGTPQIVLLGSSMSFRLFEGYFKTPLRNLSIGGGSPATGLSIISSYRSLPKIILVETNILSRPIDIALVDAFGNNPSEPFKWFRPEGCDLLGLLLDQISVGSSERVATAKAAAGHLRHLAIRQ